MKQGLLTAQQAQDVLAREAAARARVLKARGRHRQGGGALRRLAGGGGRGLPDPGAGRPRRRARPGPGQRGRRAAPRASRYRKIDPLKLDMALATRTRVPALRAEARAAAAGAAPQAAGWWWRWPTRSTASCSRTSSASPGMPIEPVLAAKADILKAIADIYGFKKTLARAADDFAHRRRRSRTSSSWSRSAARRSWTRPTSRSSRRWTTCCATRSTTARRTSTSSPSATARVVRLRIDGVLHPVYTLPARVHPPIVSRVKMLSRMDISEKRKPAGRPHQDRARGPRDRAPRLHAAHRVRREGGHPHLRSRRRWCRTSPSSASSRTRRPLFESWIDQPHGLILVTGPTGSGKTTTLYSALKALAGPDVNVTTIEDPIEMVWDGVQPGAGAAEAGARLRRRAPPHPPPGPGRHHGGRDPRRGDGGERHPVRAHRPPGALHAAHQRRGGRGEPA